MASIREFPVGINQTAVKTMSMHPPTERPIARPVAFESAPDWSVFQDEIECPLCGYNLRGLTEARCPECGSKYEWRDLLDPKRRTHKTLFEYHTDWLGKAFATTVLSGINTWRFWRSVHPVLPIRMAKLRTYGLLVLLAMFGSFFIGQASIAQQQRTLPWWASGFSGNVFLPWTWSRNDFSFVLATNFFIVDAAVWFLATIGTICVFGQSMRKAKIRMSHVFRCLVYTSDIFIWLALGYLIVDGIDAYGYSGFLTVVQWFMFLTAIFFATVRLVVAFWIYLQFPRPIATVIATQLIALLAIANVHAVTIWLR